MCEMHRTWVLLLLDFFYVNNTYKIGNDIYSKLGVSSITRNFMGDSQKGSFLTFTKVPFSVFWSDKTPLMRKLYPASLSSKFEQASQAKIAC